MPMFLSTSTNGKKLHKHIVYQLDDGTGVSSPHKDGSQHAIVIDLPPMIVNPMTGMEMPNPSAPPPVPRLSLAGEDGHTHELQELPEYSAPSGIDSETDEEKVTAVTEMYKDACQIEKKSRDCGKESKEFLRGEQWDKDIKDELEACNRACLTINHVEPNHDILSGIFRDNRTDFRVLPVEGGDSMLADILTIVVKQITNQCGFPQEENQVFDDVQDVGRGFFEIWQDYDTDIQGQIRIKHRAWDKIYCGPHEELDGSDMEYLIKKDWFTQAKMKQMWPDKVEEVDAMIHLTDDDIKSLREEPGAKFAITSVENLVDADLSDHSKKKYAVLECERKVFRTVDLLIDEETGFVFDGGLLSPTDKNDAMKIKSFRVVKRRTHDIRVTTIAGNILLDDFIAERPTNDFSILPAYAKKSGNDFWGKIEAVKDPQRELNKRRSQNTDIMDRCVIDGFFTDQNTFVNKQDEQDFEANVARPGFHQKIQDLKNPPLKVNANPYPTGVMQMESLAGDSIHRISGIVPELAGMESSNTNSGVLFAAKQRQGMVGQKFLFDNFALTKKRLGKQIIQYIQGYYPAERIVRLLKNHGVVGEQGIVSTDLGQMPEEQLYAIIQQALDNQDLLKYDIEMAESPYSTTSRQTSALLLLEMARTQPGVVPPDVIIEAFDLPGKEKILARFRQFQEQQQKAEEAKNQTEILKTQIAANAKKQATAEPNEPNLPAEVPLQQQI